ncbi:MAG: tetratricopeptide repeat protein [Xanthobacteraceae bacterium]
MNRLAWFAILSLLVGWLAGPAAADDRSTCSRAAGDEAIAACSRLIASGTLGGADAAGVIHNRARAYFAKQDWDRAIADLGEVLGFNPNGGGTFGTRGVAYFNKGDWDRAITDLSEAIRLNPRDANAFSWRGKAYTNKRDWDRAFADLGEALRLNPNDGGTFGARGVAYFTKGDWDRAIADLSEAIRLNPKDANAFSWRGKAYTNKQDWDRAFADFGEALRMNPSDGGTFGARGVAYFTKGDWDRAITDLSEAIRLNPKDANAFSWRGKAYTSKQDWDRAFADFGEALRMNPNDGGTFGARGVAYFTKGDWDRAITDLSEAIRLNPKDADAFSWRGRAYTSKQDWNRAFADLGEALRLNPNDGGTLGARGVAYFTKGDWDRAITDLGEAIRLNPKDANAFSWRGKAYTNKQDWDRAFADLGEALRLNPNDREAQRAQETARAHLATLPAAAATPSSPVSSGNGPARRVALVIGNSAYAGSARLANPANDADDVAAALRRVGFDVIEGKDLSLAGFSQIIETFRKKAKGIDVALLYYAGHGMQLGEQNWLMPIDTRVTNEFDVRHYNIALQDMISDMEAGAKTTLVFLDACRDNPLDAELKARLKAEGRGFGDSRGLARIEINAPETLLVFATRPNTTAADGVGGRNSPFTEAFLQHLPTPGVEIETLMKRVTATVATNTKGKQQPERLSRLQQEFYFVAGK